jgi:hypothetical protein
MSRRLRVLSFAILLGGLVPVVSAQEAAKSQSTSAAGSATQEIKTAPAANPADVSSVDAIMAATYDVISGPPTKARDWDRFRSLFIPGAR